MSAVLHSIQNNWAFNFLCSFNTSLGFWTSSFLCLSSSSMMLSIVVSLCSLLSVSTARLTSSMGYPIPTIWILAPSRVDPFGVPLWLSRMRRLLNVSSTVPFVFDSVRCLRWVLASLMYESPFVSLRCLHSGKLIQCSIHGSSVGSHFCKPPSQE